MKAATQSFRELKIKVASPIKLKAAPGFVAKVNCRKSPMTLTGSRYCRYEMAQFLVIKSRANIDTVNITKSRRARLAPDDLIGALPSVCITCKALREGKLGDGLFQSRFHNPRSAHKF